MSESPAAATSASATPSSPTTTVVVGVDHSEHSYYALERAVSFVAASAGAARVVAVHARRPPSAAFLALEAMARIRRIEDTDQLSMDTLIQRKASELSAKYKIEVALELVDGDPKRVLCGAVGRLRADVLVVGSHGYGPILRALFGSVSDYCCHHARCPVMVVKMAQALASPATPASSYMN